MLRSQPEKALELLYQTYLRSLLKIANKFTRDDEASRDIVQDTFLLIWSKRKELSHYHEKSIEHYLVRVVRNLAISYFKRKRYLDIDDFQFIRAYDKSNSYQDWPIEYEVISEIRALILTFPMRERQCLIMKIDNEMSLDQIAEKLQISRKMVEKSQTNGLKRLRKWAKKDR